MRKQKPASRSALFIVLGLFRFALANRVPGIVVNRDVSVEKGRRRALRSRVFELSRDGVVAEHALQSILGELAWIDWLNSAQGEAIRRAAEELLRLPSLPGIRIPKGEIRPCKSYSRHNQQSRII
jgi:hypothetical protein